jgi:hypothetical protein
LPGLTVKSDELFQKIQAFEKLMEYASVLKIPPPDCQSVVAILHVYNLLLLENYLP